MTKEELPNIDKEKTGKNICRLMRLHKISMYDLQMTLGFQSPTNIYQWRQGKYLPSVDNLYKLAYIFDCKMEDFIVKEEKGNEQT